MCLVRTMGRDRAGARPCRTSPLPPRTRADRIRSEAVRRDWGGVPCLWASGRRRTPREREWGCVARANPQAVDVCESPEFLEASGRARSGERSGAATSPLGPALRPRRHAARPECMAPLPDASADFQGPARATRALRPSAPRRMDDRPGGVHPVVRTRDDRAAAHRRVTDRLRTHRRTARAATAAERARTGVDARPLATRGRVDPRPIPREPTEENAR